MSLLSQYQDLYAAKLCPKCGTGLKTEDAFGCSLQAWCGTVAEAAVVAAETDRLGTFPAPPRSKLFAEERSR